MFANQNDYEELIFRKSPKYINIWLSFIIFLLIFLIMVCYFYKYNKFYEINGLVLKEGSDNYVQILLENDKLDIINNDNLSINYHEINFNYEIGQHFYSDSGRVYREVKLFFENDLKNGEIVAITFKSPQTTIIEEFKKKLKKGMM